MTVLPIEMSYPLPLFMVQHKEKTLLLGKAVPMKGWFLHISEFIIRPIIGAGIAGQQLISAVNAQNIIPQPETNALTTRRPFGIEIIVLHQSITRLIKVRVHNNSRKARAACDLLKGSPRTHARTCCGAR